MKNEIVEKKNGDKKSKILTFIIGVLVGAIITAGVFLIFKPKSSRNIPDFSSFNKDGSGFNFSGERRSRSNETIEDDKVEEDTKEESNNESKS